MDKKHYEELYKKAKRIIGRKTPLRSDCGALCSARCCKGSEDVGMVLFPHESTHLQTRCREDGRTLVALCGGRCKRDSRPLACRIFPFFPVADEGGRITVSADSRGFGICPLLQNIKSVRLSRRFLHRVKLLGELLYTDCECREFIKSCGEEIKDASALLSRI